MRCHRCCSARLRRLPPAASDPAAPPSTRRGLTLPVQIGYAFAEIGQNLVETAIRIYLLIYYTDVVGLNARLAGIAVGLSLVWDACIDPVMGAISDRTRHRFGGRRGYLPLGGLLLAGGLLAVFHPPELDSQWARFGWLLFSSCFLGTGMTVLSVPYMAMGGELTEHPHERAVLFGWRFGFANFGGMLAAALPTLFLQAGETNAVAMRPVSVLAAGIVVVTAWTSFWAVRGLAVPTAPAAAVPLRAAFVLPLRNPTFRPLLLVYVIATIGIGVNSACALYYYQYRLHLAETQIQGLLVLFLGVFTTSILGWVLLAKRFGKRRPMALGAIALGIGTAALYLLAEPGNFLVPLLAGGLGLGALVGCIVLIDTLLTDVIDHDQVRSRQVRSGLYFGVWRFASKLARAASIGAAGYVLDLAGFVPNQPQTEGVELALMLLFGPGVGGFFVVAGALLWRYRFDEQKQAQVRRILDRRAMRVGANGAR